MQTSDMLGWEYHTALQKFVENLDDVVSKSDYKTVDGVDMVCIKLLDLPTLFFFKTWFLKNSDI